MSGTIERLRLGQRRATRLRLPPGTYPDGEGHVIVADVPFYIDVTEEYQYEFPSIQKGELKWHRRGYNWTTMKPADAVEPAPKPEPPVTPKLSWWRRLFGFGTKLPNARVVSR